MLANFIFILFTAQFFTQIEPFMPYAISLTGVFASFKAMSYRVKKDKEAEAVRIQIEKENQDTSEQDIMTLYDGFELQNIIAENISITDNTLHIIFTNKLTVTFDNDDFRYHARALISSNPTIISTTGIIEAPAKPKQYYLDLMTNFSEEKINSIPGRRFK